MNLTDRLKDALKPRYELGPELGRGGMAVVYSARDLKHDRDVAVKVLRDELTLGAAAQRFLREIEIAAHLHHPNILPLFDSGEQSGVFYYVMPLVEGDSLRDRLKNEGQLSLDEALKIAREAAQALSYAHEQGVVHRDIKPENILFEGGQAVVADFGIARALSRATSDRITETGLAVGTPEYMSPEQGAGHTVVDARTDIYALGCVLFEMLAGEPPYTGRNPQAILARHMLERPPSLEVVRPDIPPGVAAAVRRCLAKTPADRFASADEFIEALEQPSSDRVADRRSRWKLGAGMGSFIVVAGIVAWFALAQPQQLDPRRIVVFPLEEHGLLEEEVGAGYQAALMVEIALDHTEPLRWIDGRKRLEPALRERIGLLSPQAARRISRERRAAYYIDGVVQRMADSLSVVLYLQDVAGDSLVSTESASAFYADANAGQLALRAVPGLLGALLAPDREVDLSPLAGRSAAAVALWLQGEREYRKVQFAGALRFYQRALLEDSALAFAAITGAQAANWYHNTEEAKTLVTLALNNEDLLPDRYRHFARGLRDYLAGQGDSAVASFERALQGYPDWAEAWMALGEVYNHLLPKRSPLDSLARSAFERAIEDDNSFAPALYHLAEAAVRRGEVELADDLISRFEELDPDLALDLQLRLMLRCVADEGVDWGEAAAMDPKLTLKTAASLSVGGRQLRCAKQGFRAALESDSSDANVKWGALMGLQGLLLAEGRVADVMSVIDSALASGTRGARVLYYIDALAGAPVEEKVAAADSMIMRVWGDDYRGASTPVFLWLFGAWQVQRGDTERVSAIVEELQLRAASGDTDARFFSDVLSAHLLYLQGDTLAGIEALRNLTPQAPREIMDWAHAEPLAFEQLRLAELLLARGEYEEASAVATVFDHPTPVIYLSFLAPSLSIRYRAALALDRQDLVAELSSRLLGLGREDLLEVDL